MTLNELLPELLQLRHDEMIQAIEILKNQVETNNTQPIADNVGYEVWSPTITLETARILQEVLQEAQNKHG